MTVKPPPDTPPALDAEVISMLQSIFNLSGQQQGGPALGDLLPKTASVKFMITRQDEEGLCQLGYSQDEIHKMKPQRAREILSAGTRAGTASLEVS
jgi:hypothetical protein